MAVISPQYLLIRVCGGHLSQCNLAGDGVRIIFRCANLLTEVWGSFFPVLIGGCGCGDYFSQ